MVTDPPHWKEPFGDKGDKYDKILEIIAAINAAIAWDTPVDADIVPDTDSSRDLGSTTKAFANVIADIIRSVSHVPSGTTWNATVPNTTWDFTLVSPNIITKAHTTNTPEPFQIVFMVDNMWDSGAAETWLYVSTDDGATWTQVDYRPEYTYLEDDEIWMDDDNATDRISDAYGDDIRYRIVVVGPADWTNGVLTIDSYPTAWYKMEIDQGDTST